MKVSAEGLLVVGHRDMRVDSAAEQVPIDSDQIHRADGALAGVVSRPLSSLWIFTMLMAIPQVLTIWISHQGAEVGILTAVTQDASHTAIPAETRPRLL